jgi:acyl-CoA thioesterase
VATFAAVSTPVRDGDNSFTLDVPDGWQQGRGAFGGLIFAALIRAMEAVLADIGPDAPAAPSRVARLRSLTGALPGPTEVGPAPITVEVLRRGSALTTLAARVVQAGEVRAHAVGVFGTARAPVTWQTQRPPEMPPWHEVPVVPSGPGGFTPAFLQHWELRLVGPVPFSRGSEARCAGWVRARDPGPARDAAYIAAYADAFWPAAYAVLPAPRPMATVGYTLELIEPIDDLDPDAPLYYQASAPAAIDGFTYELRELWGADGRLVARNHQTFVIIK